MKKCGLPPVFGGQQAQPRLTPQPRQSAPTPPESSGGGIFGSLGGTAGPRGGNREGVIEAAAKGTVRGIAGSVGRGIGNQILRGVVGFTLGGGAERRSTPNRPQISGRPRENVVSKMVVRHHFHKIF